MIYEYAIQTFDYLFVIILLWRVETLQELDDTTTEADDLEGITAFASVAYSTNIPSNIGQLLEQYCEATQLYLQHDLKLDDFCRAVGTNRTYLSQHFTQHNTTYNAYINGLRIQHFVRLYREAVATNRSFTAQQLAQESGFRSYSTFAVAFKQRMGQTVMKWMRNAEK
jgi:AraC-like DNA-binding protein